MPVDQMLASALEDLTLDSVDSLEPGQEWEQSLTLSHGITEAGASSCCACCECSCLACSCCSI
jgi:hypothetical protein